MYTKTPSLPHYDRPTAGFIEMVSPVKSKTFQDLGYNNIPRGEIRSQRGEGRIKSTPPHTLPLNKTWPTCTCTQCLPQVKGKEGVLGGWSLGGHHIKAFGHTPFLHQRRISTEGRLGQYLKVCLGEHWHTVQKYLTVKERHGPKASIHCPSDLCQDRAGRLPQLHKPPIGSWLF